MGQTEEPVNYEEFERMHVVRRLRQIVGSWWKVQLNFTDANGFLRGVPQGRFFNPTNSVCKFITENDAGFEDCRNEAKLTAATTLDQNEPRVGTCHAGYSTLSLPLRIENRFLGCIFADGFVMEETADEQRDKLRRYLAKKFPSDAKDLEAYISTLPVLGKKDVEYLTELLRVVIEEAISLHKTQFDLDEKLQALSAELHNKYDFSRVIGSAPAMQSVLKLLSRVCESDATILITGENGTGKEIIARTIHYNSRRKKQNFVVQNCGALNDNLLESELFGHVKGSFTNAIKDKKGLFELADRGTLFLDEIGDTSPSMQVKLLRVLQEGTFIPVGGSEQRTVDVRVLAATNKNLEQMVKDGTFREDLYYRLNVINIKIPPLRERKDDIKILVTKFLGDQAKIAGEKSKKMDPKCMEALERYDWPGNVRELQNEMERLCVLAGGDELIGAELLSDRILATKAEKYPGLRVEGKLKDAIEELERKMIFDGLIREDWNKTRVAKLLGISRAGLIMKCDKYGISKDERFKSAKD
jgi:transcriptional regulator with PAS, ATPase and Fis domain